MSSKFAGDWTTANPPIATVDTNGVHTGVSVGSTSTTTSGYLIQQGSLKCPIKLLTPTGNDNVQLSVSFSNTPIVPLGKPVPITATVDPPSNTVPITLTISTTNGTGSATFGNGSTTKTITTTTVLTIVGVTASSTANNIKLAATVSSAQAAYTTFTVTVAVTGAIPVNFMQTSFTPLPASAALQFTYTWGSSSGNMMDISTCEVEEFVTYPGYTPGVQQVYYWTTPPYVGGGVNSNNPDTAFTPVSGNTGVVGLKDTQGHFGFAKPYVYNSVPSQQVFQFSCPNYKLGTWTQLLPLSGTIPITRVVSQSPTWQYEITKSGRSIVGILP